MNVSLRLAQVQKKLKRYLSTRPGLEFQQLYDIRERLSALRDQVQADGTSKRQTKQRRRHRKTNADNSKSGNVRHLECKGHERATGILAAAVDARAATPDEIRALVMTCAEGTRESQEDAALLLLLQGCDGTREQWQATFGNSGLEWGGWTEAILRQTDSWRTEDDMLARLTETHLPIQILATESNEGPGQLLLWSVLQLLLALTFAADWEKFTEGDDNGEDRTRFYHQAFKLSYAARFAGLSEEEQNAVFKDSREVYKRWRKKEEALVTARNLLLRIYRVFGPVIFMNPYWGPRNVQARSKSFGWTLKAVIEQLADLPLVGGMPMISGRYSDSEHAFKSVVDAWGNEISRACRDFMALNPDHVPDRADLDEEQLLYD
ncbi:hypothetical protein C8R46DRAFT_1211232 [Mycena filopes]|nr:hypothetical protein C8R46DRAFT_1211232 [Mycena filopes]